MGALADFLQQIVNGVAVGGIYALVALGFVLIYQASHTVNFAQGEFMMLGAFFFYTFSTVWGLDYWIGAPLAIACVGLLGAALGRALIRPAPERHALAGVLVTVGVGVIASNGVRLVPGWGSETRAVAAPFSDQIVKMGSVAIGGDRLAIVAASIVLVALLQYCLMRTRPGLAVRALSQDQAIAHHLGVPILPTISALWAASTGIAAFAGVLLAPSMFVHADMGYLAFHAFPAAVLGGFVSIPGTIVGGLVVGIAEELAGFYLPEGAKNVVPHTILLAALLLRPHGIFGVARIDRA